MKLYFVRHGESEANRDYVHAGWAPVHLTEKGISDARKAGALIKNIKFEHVFSSDLVRVRETCFYATGIDLPELRPELREMGVGSLSGKCPNDLMKELGDEYRMHFENRDYRSYGGENMDDIFSRVSAFMRMLEHEPYAGMERILAFGSEGSIDMALAYVMGKSDTMMVRRAICDNGSICVFEFKDSKWRLDKWNYTGVI